MDRDQKKDIIKRFMQETSDGSVILSDDEATYSATYRQFRHVLDSLERSHAHFLNFADVKTDEDKWTVLKTVLQAGITIDQGVLIVDKRKMRQRADGLYLDTLPQPDYYNRTTQPDSAAQAEIKPIIDQAKAKLSSLLNPDPLSILVDCDNNAAIELFIGRLQEAKIDPSNANLTEYLTGLQKQITLAEDLLKINRLTTITIPGEHGEPPMTYCTLAESAGGMTQKVSLVKLETVTQQLNQLVEANPATMDDYLTQRDQYKLSPQAIIKLPKYGKIVEVQREAMALNISRMLGLDTTRSSIMTHDGKPALFVPFEKIRLLKEFAKGEDFTAINFKPLPEFNKYEHYSTINPVGSGLQGDRFIEDFGNYFSLFYVCSDTDSIGGYNQNKALRDSRSLFVFDQVVMPSDKMKLDSRLSLQPDQSLMKHTRHGQGRNRTVIEDSSFNHKFASLINLAKQQERICRYARRTAVSHNGKIKEIDAQLAGSGLSAENITQLNAQKNELKTLRNDALKLEQVIQSRIQQINQVLPKRSSNLKDEDVRQALVLEKLMHNPVLFTENGRPYKYPWTYRQNNPVKSIEANPAGDKVVLTFRTPVSSEMVSFLKRAGIDVSKQGILGRQLVLSHTELNRLKEDMLHPEASLAIDHQKNYLDPPDLKQIGKAYGNGNQAYICELMDLYQKSVDDESSSSLAKIQIMDNARIFLQQAINETNDTGFGMHVMKKLHFDMQKRLQAMMDPNLKPPNMDAAFAGALKLDRVDTFNKVVASALANNRLDKPEFREFLNGCERRAVAATNHDEGVQASQAVEDHARGLLAVFKVAPEVDLEDENVKLGGLNPEDTRREAVSQQCSQLGGLAFSNASILNTHLTGQGQAQAHVEQSAVSSIVYNN